MLILIRMRIRAINQTCLRCICQETDLRGAYIYYNSFFIVPEMNHADKFTSSNDTKKVVFDVLRPAKCAFKVNKSLDYCARNAC